jgi:hypothetical protein
MVQCLSATDNPLECCTYRVRVSVLELVPQAEDSAAETVVCRRQNRGLQDATDRIVNTKAGRIRPRVETKKDSVAREDG